MEKINWKIFNTAFWIEVVLSYILPFKATNASGYQVGFPVPFITVYDARLGINPLMSMHLNPIGLIFDGIIIYLLVSICIKTYQKIKGLREG